MSGKLLARPMLLEMTMHLWNIFFCTPCVKRVYNDLTVHSGAEDYIGLFFRPGSSVSKPPSRDLSKCLPWVYNYLELEKRLRFPLQTRRVLLIKISAL